MSQPIKPLFEIVPAKVYDPNKPLFASAGTWVHVNLLVDEIPAICPRITLSRQQVEKVQFDVAQINLNSSQFNFIDDIGISPQQSLAGCAGWTSRAATSKIFADTQACMQRIHSEANQHVQMSPSRFANLASRLFDQPSNQLQPRDNHSISREVDWLKLTGSERGRLLDDSREHLTAAIDLSAKLDVAAATCACLIAKAKSYPQVIDRAAPRMQSLDLSRAICQQLRLQLANLIAELDQVGEAVKSVSLNLVPAWNVNRSL